MLYISPIIYTYVEPSINSQQYVDAALNSHGYRIVGGIGSDRISLFNGEVHGGFASQQFANPAIGTVSVPVFGGSLSWYPTRFITVTYNADRTFGTSDFSQNLLTPAPIINPTTGLIPGSPTDNFTQTLKANWDFSRHFAFTAGVQSQQQAYLDSFRNPQRCRREVATAEADGCPTS
jgi:hypothetical protein